MLRLESLVVHQFRGVLPGTTLTFNRGSNILLGRNATGKTTLLNLVSTILRADFSDIADEAFDLEFRISSSAAQLLGRVINQRVSAPREQMPLEVPREQMPIEKLPPPRFRASVRYELRTERPEFSMAFESNDKEASVTTGEVTSKLPPLNLSLRSLYPYFLFPPEGHPANLPMASEFLNSQSYRFDESLECFRAMIGSEMRTQWGCPPAASLEIIRTRGSGRPIGLIPVYIPTQVYVKLFTPLRDVGEGAHARVAPAEGLLLTKENAPFLKRAAKAMQYENARWSAEVVETLPDGDSDRTRFGRFAIGFSRHRRFTTHDQLSYGQKRLLAFLYYLDVNGRSPIVADELVNGLHHGWIEYCLGLIGRKGPNDTPARQSFLTSQNPLLFNYLGTLASADDLRSAFVICRTEEQEGRPLMEWKQMEASEATRLFEEYEVGIEHISEILKRRGLW